MKIFFLFPTVGEIPSASSLNTTTNNAKNLLILLLFNQSLGVDDVIDNVDKCGEALNAIALVVRKLLSSLKRENWMKIFHVGKRLLSIDVIESRLNADIALNENER